MKKIFVLRPVGYHDSFEEGLWDPWYDKAFGFLIAADDETEARTMASNAHSSYEHEMKAAWLNPELTTCKEISSYAETDTTEILMADIRTA